VNPTGKFEIGGPMGDCGLTGRKIIVDTYGGAARHGGGAVQWQGTRRRSTAARRTPRGTSPRTWWQPASRTAARCRVAYAIGVAHPVSVMVDTFGTERIGRAQIIGLINEHFDYGRAPSASTWTCTGRSTRRPRPTATSA